MKQANIRYIKQTPIDNSKPRRLIPLPDHIPAGRTCHLVDIENLMGGPFEGEQKLWDAVHAYQTMVPVWGRDDVVYVAMNPAITKIVKRIWKKNSRYNNWPKATFLVGLGIDGADKKLLAVVADHKQVLENYERVVVGSGDGIFGPVVERFSSYGMEVLVVAQPSSVSGYLKYHYGNWQVLMLP